MSFLGIWGKGEGLGNDAAALRRRLVRLARRYASSRPLQMGVLFSILVCGVWIGYDGTSTNPETGQPKYLWLAQMQQFTFDTYNRLKPRPYSGGVRILDIDDASLARIGQWPWPRTVIADIVTRLNDLGAKIIIFDIVFAEPDRTSPEQLAPRLPDLPEKPLAEEILSKFPSHDEILAETIKQAENVVMGFPVSNSNDGAFPALKHPIFLRPRYDISKLLQRLKPVPSAVVNLPMLEEAAAGVATFFVRPEVDGLVRKVPPLLVVNGGSDDPSRAKIYPSLVIEALRLVSERKDYRLLLADIPNAKQDLPVAMRVGTEIEFPLDSDGTIRVWYSGHRDDRYVPVWQLLDGSLAPELIKDHFVILGTSAEGLRDIKQTPLDPFISGSEVHAELIEQALNKQYLSRPHYFKAVELFFIAVVGLLIVFILPLLNAAQSTAFGAAMVGLPLAGAWVAYSQHGLLIDAVYPVTVLLVLYVTSLLFQALRSEAQGVEIREAFSHYLAPELVRRLAANPDQLRLGGEDKELTILFSDIRGFTSVSETLDPVTLTQVVNDFLTPMSDIVLATGGTIDKYMGDCIMAFWNAPLDDPDHARNACHAALRMNDALAPVNEKLKRDAEAAGRPFKPLGAGIGVNTGHACVGNMGSRQRFAYSVIGDEVNLASRLEGLTRTYGVPIVIGEKTLPAIEDWAWLELDLIRVKGKAEPTRVFALLGEEEAAQAADFSDLRDRHKRMLSLYRARDFEAAADLLAPCRALAHGALDELYELYFQRILLFRADPPRPDWDGVFTATSK